MTGKTPRELRQHLLTALEADLIGPFRWQDGHAAKEVLKQAPSRWYLTGFLAPEGGRDTADPTSDDDFQTEGGGDEDEPEPGDPDPKQRKFFPASLGMSVLLPKQATHVTATVWFADYVMIEEELPPKEGGKRKRKEKRWHRTPLVVEPVTVPLDNRALSRGIDVPNASGIKLEGRVATTDAPGLPEGAQALALFVVNHRTPEEEVGLQDRQFIFQVKLRVECAEGVVARADLTDVDANDWDAQVSDLQFRDSFEYAVGHGVSVHVPDAEQQLAKSGKIVQVETTWLPRHEVRRVKTHGDKAVTTEMAALAQLDSAARVESALGQLPVLYAEWIADQRKRHVGTDKLGASREETRDGLMDRAELACARITEGIELLKTSDEARAAFCIANQAMATQAERRNPSSTDKPAWRLFQLAFVLLNLPALCDPHHKQRTSVELIFFPTGGGKTEAYLGVIAFALVLRRMRGQGRPDKGLGVAVLLRYTLRLLTLDQLERATTLMCALELLRQREPARLGAERFLIGLWVGKGSTENRLTDVAKKVSAYKNKNGPSPCPLTRCPWCNKPLAGDGLILEPNAQAPERLVTACSDWECEFSGAKNRAGLPIAYIDDQVYSELPSFVLATVDKFAMLPWRGESGMLFGKVKARRDDRFYGPMHRVPKGAVRLPEGLLPPELIVQDELHLISGPLGTMVGLYETAIEHLCTRTVDGKAIKPKIIAATATVRRAQHQIAALYGRPQQTRLFPPPGIDDGETFFATIDRENPGRLYVGVAAPGRSMKMTLVRAYVSLLTGGEYVFDRKGPVDQAADHYMTIAGYFNSLRELGGMRRLVEDTVRWLASTAEARAPLDWAGPHPLWKNRDLSVDVLELTSREAAANIKSSKELLKTPYLAQGRQRADVLLASNMISVGVDIDRLGVMVVAGQPKTTAEYIQASSRVGRPSSAAGLVVTCFNPSKARDRSHYEGFVAYHQCFYRHVEATSVTPFSLPALDRGLGGVLVAMARFCRDELTPALGVNELQHHRGAVAEAVAALVARARKQGGSDSDVLAEAIQDRAESFLDDWESAVRETHEGGGKRVYTGFEPVDAASVMPLLRGALDEQVQYNEEAKRFVVPTSMRDVEASVHLWIPKDVKGGGA